MSAAANVNGAKVRNVPSLSLKRSRLSEATMRIHSRAAIMYEGHGRPSTSQESGGVFSSVRPNCWRQSGAHTASSLARAQMRVQLDRQLRTSAAGNWRSRSRRSESGRSSSSSATGSRGGEEGDGATSEESMGGARGRERRGVAEVESARARGGGG
eukprot:scaffold55906_cov27-Tisochrysis_lutea.AAC.1